MKTRKTGKKDSNKKKFLFIDLELFFENLKLLLLVVVAVFLLYSSFEILSKVADLFLDVPMQVLLALILIIVVFYVVLPPMFNLKNKLPLFLQFIVFPVILLCLFRTLGVKSLTDIPYFVPYLVLLLTVIYFYIFVLQHSPLKNFNYRAAYVIIAVLLLFVVGMLVAFSSVFDAQTNLGLSLNNCEDNQRIPGSNFACEGLREDLFVGEKAECLIQGLEQHNLTTKLNFTHFNGTRSDYAYSPGDSISFIVPADVARVNVKIQSAEPGDEYCASSAGNMTFTTYANFRQQQKELGFYFLAIISFILISVPTIIGNWMNLFKGGKKQ